MENVYIGVDVGGMSIKAGLVNEQGKILHKGSIKTNSVNGGKEALLNRDYDKVGQLLLQSHASLRDNFEVSTPELDILVEIASSCEDVYGSRMTGGGFGGCIVCLVKTAGANHLMELLRNEYKKRTGIECSVFLTSPSQGARILSPYEVDEVSPCCCSSSSGKCPMKRIVKNPLFWVVSGTVAVGSALFLLRRRNN